MLAALLVNGLFVCGSVQHVEKDSIAAWQHCDVFDQSQHTWHVRAVLAHGC